MSFKDRDEEESVIEFHSIFPKMSDIFPEPIPAKTQIPQWFKDTKPYLTDGSPKDGLLPATVKKCPAFLDSFVTGYYLLSPVDIYIDTTNGKKDIQTAGNHMFIRRPLLGGHSYEQYDKMPIDTEVYHPELFRLNLAWIIKTAPGYSSLFINPLHSDAQPLTAIDGIIDTDEFLPDGLFSFLVKNNFKGIIKRGTPLIQVIPYKRVGFSHKIIIDRDISEKLQEQVFKFRSVFSSGYKKFFHSSKRFD